MLAFSAMQFSIAKVTQQNIVENLLGSCRAFDQETTSDIDRGLYHVVTWRDEIGVTIDG